MKQVVPDYYEKFKCIANHCRHNCCIGWEIDIDTETLRAYRELPGTFGDRLRSHIHDEAFVLDKEERCPFLNPKGLCEIICTLGEGALCQICADHPRFRNFYSDRVEMGLGLCCEAAAQVILSHPMPMRLTEIQGDPLPEEQTFFAFRRQIFAILQDRTQSIDQRVEAMLELCHGELPEKNIAQWAQVYLKLERLDSAWDALLENLHAAGEAQERPLVYEQLLVYFIYRHLAGALEDGRLKQRVLFAALSYQMIRAISAAHPTVPLEEIARMYSAEIEYSDQNMEVIFNLLA
ncbi:MAG: flagellin lysine-N-methylase [Clostridia bacterium]|nr:flagellin lysine-N-methylase [Clostridia bacterium]